jgi:hypothetical protein
VQYIIGLKDQLIDHHGMRDIRTIHPGTGLLIGSGWTVNRPWFSRRFERPVLAIHQEGLNDRQEGAKPPKNLGLFTVLGGYRAKIDQANFRIVTAPTTNEMKSSMTTAMPNACTAFSRIRRSQDVGP